MGGVIFVPYHPHIAANPERRLFMGVFSWMDCINQSKNIKMCDRAYVLIPKEFGGGHIEESSYDGYGHFGGRDIFELVAEWNRNELGEQMLRSKPQKKSYGGLWSYEIDELRKQGLSEEEINKKDEEAQEENYQNALKRRECSIRRMEDYRAGKSDEEMTEKYGEEWKRGIGIDIACYDEQNAALKYPIKITHSNTAVYEFCEPSNGDPDQGY